MNQSSERWSRISTLFDELVELAPDEREQHLSDLAQIEPEIAAELRGMLAADEDADALLDAGAAAAMTYVMDDAEPLDRIVGTYRLLSILGEGGMGVVWLAERTDGAYEQQVAIKVLKRGMDTHAILRRFLQERRILARLTHPHIVRLLDGGMSAGGRPYYVMEHVAGQSIMADAAARKLGVRARMSMLIQVAEAVAFAHAQLVVHRDLKPSNVLIDSSGEPRVLDFGIAKLIEASGEQTLTETGVRVLSPAYAAPEQVLGEPVGTATDVYALGLMLCELVSGRLPHRRGASTFGLLHEIENESIERPSVLLAHSSMEQVSAMYGADADSKNLQRNLRGDLDRIATTALQRDPLRRYATAAAFADDLRHWLDGLPIAAQADSAAYRFRKFVRRHRVAVAATALIVLSLLAGLGGALYQADQAHKQTARAERVKDFLIGVFRQSDPALAQGKPLSAAEILNQGRADLDKSLVEDSSSRGELLIAIAEIQMNLGEWSDGLATAELAVPLLEATDSTDDPRMAAVYSVRGQLYAKEVRFAEAEQDLRRARALLATNPSANTERLDELDRSLAFVLTHTESPAAAVALQQQVVERLHHRLAEGHPVLAEHRLSLALMLEEVGDYAQAEAEYALGLPVLIEAKGALAPGVCEAESNYAGLLDRIGKSTDALPHFDKALDCRRQLYGSESVLFAQTLFSRGILMLGLSRYADAQADFVAASARFGEYPNNAAHAQRYMGMALAGQEHYSQAAASFAEAERLYREADLPNDKQRWRARADRGYAVFKGGDPVTGRKLLDEALAGLGDVVPTRDTHEFMRPLRALGEVARATGDHQVALDAHRRWHKLAIKLNGADSRDAHQSSHQLSLDLADVGDRKSLTEAQALIVDALQRARATSDADLPAYEQARRDIEVALSRLPDS